MKQKNTVFVMGHSAPSPRPTTWAALLVALVFSLPFAAAALFSLLW